MNISGIRPYSDFYEYSSMRASEIKLAQIQSAKESLVVADSAAIASDELNQSIDTNKTRSQNEGNEEYSKRYQPDITYELKGKESDLAKLDESNEITISQKDKLLQQYKIFVGETSKQKEISRLQEERDLTENFFTN